MGKKPRKVVEALGNRQYHICVDGCNQVILLNQCFLCEMNPVIESPCYPWSEDTPEFLDTEDIPTGLRLQHAELQSANYQPRPTDMEPMEVEDVDSPEKRRHPPQWWRLMRTRFNYCQTKGHTAAEDNRDYLQIYDTSHTHYQNVPIHDNNVNILWSHVGRGHVWWLKECYLGMF